MQLLQAKSEEEGSFQMALMDVPEAKRSVLTHYLSL